MERTSLPSRAVGIAGMPGSGKSLVASVAASLGYLVYSMGDTVRELAKERGLESTPDSLGRLMLSIRSEAGPAVVAVGTLEKISLEEPTNVCIEGLRSLDEVALFRRTFPSFVVVAIYSAPRTRYLRLTTRDRRDDPKSRELFEERDRREIGVGLGGVLALADFAIVNEGTIADLKVSAAKILEVAEIGVQARR